MRLLTALTDEQEQSLIKIIETRRKFSDKELARAFGFDHLRMRSLIYQLQTKLRKRQTHERTDDTLCTG